RSRRRVFRGGGAAIAMTGLKMALKPGTGTPYDTGSLSVGYAGPPAAMDARPGNKPVEFRPPLASIGQAGVDSTYELVERAKSGDDDALNRLFARYLPSLRRWASGRRPRRAPHTVGT